MRWWSPPTSSPLNTDMLLDSPPCPVNLEVAYLILISAIWRTPDNDNDDDNGN